MRTSYEMSGVSYHCTSYQSPTTLQFRYINMYTLHEFINKTDSTEDDIRRTVKACTDYNEAARVLNRLISRYRDVILEARRVMNSDELPEVTMADIRTTLIVAVHVLRRITVSKLEEFLWDRRVINLDDFVGPIADHARSIRCLIMDIKPYYRALMQIEAQK